MTHYWQQLNAADIASCEYLTESSDAVRVFLKSGDTFGFPLNDPMFAAVEEWGGAIAPYKEPPAPAPPAPVEPTPAEKLAAAGLTVEELKALLAT